MPRISLNSIRRDNAKLVLEAISRKKHITKLEIANETGLSLMTVGKIINALGAGGIITHSMSNKQKIGRRAEVFSIRYDWLIPIFEISSHKFKFIITDLEENIVDKIEYLCSEDPLYISNEYVSFLKKTLVLLKNKYKNKKILGIGVSICGIYDNDADRIVSSAMPEFSKIKLMLNISKIFKTNNVVIDNANRLCAESLIRSTQDFRNKTISCVSINETVECSICEKGLYFKGSNNLAGRLGDLPYLSGTFSEYARESKNVDDIYLPTVNLLKTVVLSYDPDVIYLCSDKFVFNPYIKDKINYAVMTELPWPNEKRPELIAVYSSALENVNGIISRVIDNWLDKLTN